MKYLCLILIFSFSVVSAQAYLQTNRPFHSQPYGGFYNYSPYLYPYAPYEPDNGPMRGPNSIEAHKYGYYSSNRSYDNSYPYTPYQPYTGSTGPMRDPNNTQGQ